MRVYCEDLLSKVLLVHLPLCIVDLLLFNKVNVFVEKQTIFTKHKGHLLVTFIFFKLNIFKDVSNHFNYFTVEQLICSVFII